MSQFDEYTQISRNAMLVKSEIIGFKPLDSRSLSYADVPESDDAAFLKTLGLGKPYIEMFSRRASLHGSTFEAELLSSGLVTEDAYFGAFARFLRLPFVAELDHAVIVDTPSLDIQLRDTRMVRLSPLPLRSGRRSGRLGKDAERARRSMLSSTRPLYIRRGLPCTANRDFCWVWGRPVFWAHSLRHPRLPSSCCTSSPPCFT
jgi:hypothetical protein